MFFCHACDCDVLGLDVVERASSHSLARDLLEALDHAEAAAERMRERCAAYVERRATRLGASSTGTTITTLKDCAEELGAMPIDELEPEETSE